MAVDIKERIIGETKYNSNCNIRLSKAVKEVSNME
jgi:hypothetical protein